MSVEGKLPFWMKLFDPELLTRADDVHFIKGENGFVITAANLRLVYKVKARGFRHYVTIVADNANTLARGAANKKSETILEDGAVGEREHTFLLKALEMTEKPEIDGNDTRPPLALLTAFLKFQHKPDPMGGY